MSALLWQIKTRLKNSLRAFFKKPSNWVLLILFAGLMGTVFFTGAQPTDTPRRPIDEVYGMVFLLLSAVYLFAAYQGLGRGTSLYSMADVQLLFPAPFSPSHLLYFGLLQRLGTSLLTGCFLLFQYGWLGQGYGVSFWVVLVIVLLYALALFLGQMTAMAIYAAVSGSSKKRLVATCVFFGVIAVFGAIGLAMALTSGKTGLAAALALIGTPVTDCFPVGGWLACSFRALMTGDFPAVLPGMAASVALIALLTARIAHLGSDFYEDVLAATARSHQAITAQKEGRMQEALPENVAVGKTGLGGGWGASALFYKHRLESRRGRRFLLDTTTMVFAVISIVFAFVMRGEGILPAFAFATYMQLFSVNTGRWVRELTQPWVYRLPDSAFRRLVACLGESVLTYALEAAVVMIPIGLIAGVSGAEIAMAVVARFLISLLFVGANLLEERFFGGTHAKMLTLALYFLMILLLLAPGIALMVFLLVGGQIVVSLPFTVMGALALPTLLVTPLCLFLSRGVLDNAELTGS